MAQIVDELSLSNVFCNCHWRISTENITPSLMLDEARIETSYIHAQWWKIDQVALGPQGLNGFDCFATLIGIGLKTYIYFIH